MENAGFLHFPDSENTESTKNISSEGGLTTKKDDELLFEHFNSIKNSVQEVTRIINTYQASDVKNFELMFCDLRHIMEIEDLSDEQYLKLKEIELDIVKKRRVVKNILEVCSDLQFFSKLEKDLNNVSQKMESNLTNSHKVYNFRHPDSLKFLKEISDVESDSDFVGRYKTDQLARKTRTMTVQGEREENATKNSNAKSESLLDVKPNRELPDFGVATLADKEKREKVKDTPNFILDTGRVSGVDKYIDNTNIEKTISQLENLKSATIQSLNEDVTEAVKKPLNQQQINKALQALKRNSKRNRSSRSQSY